MVSGISVMVKALNINGMHVDRVQYFEDSAVINHEEYQSDRIVMDVRPFKRIKSQCPYCRKKCPTYDHKADHASTWRANSLNGVPVYLSYRPKRIHCKEHGVLTEYLPWADGFSRFTAGFNDEVAFLSLTSPKTVVSQFMDINWRTVGNCIKASHDRIEPDVTVRLHGLKRICVDETSYSSGHKYITVVYDIDRNRVVWLHLGHGFEVFRQFCEQLTEKERDGIEVVAGDGARWIDQCVDMYFRNCRRCTDFFHVVGWVNEALDKAKNSARRDAETEIAQLKKEFEEAEKQAEKMTGDIRKEMDHIDARLAQFPKRGRPCKEKTELQQYRKALQKQLEELQRTDEITVTEQEYKDAVEELSKLPKRGRNSSRKAHLKTIIAIYEEHKESGAKVTDIHRKMLDDKKEQIQALKDSKYALGMNPENLGIRLRDKLALIEVSNPELYKLYEYKEQIRIILHMKDVELAAVELDGWIEEVSQCGSKYFEVLAEKIKRHRQNILNAIELQVNSSKSEATNTTIKSLISTARGFRNLKNMFALIYLRCSDLTVPLHNRYQPSPETMKDLREIQNKRRKDREEARRNAALS